MMDTGITRIAVFSDTHGNGASMRKMILACGPFDYLFHLGDGVEDARAVAGDAGIPLTGISGNEDQGSNFPRKQKVPVQGREFLLIHGDQFDITPYHSGEVLEGLYEKMALMTQIEGCDILLFGHTHKPLLAERNNIILCNPGDQYIGSQSAPTFAVITIDGADISFRILQEKGNGEFPEIQSLGRSGSSS